MYIKVRVKTSMKNDAIRQKSKDHFEVDVREKAERNMANKKVLELIREYFKLEKGVVRIVSGHHSPSKILSLPE